MKTTNSRTVEELNLDVKAPAVTPTKVQNHKIVRALKKLSLTDPDETLIVKHYQGPISDTACFLSGFRTWESSAGLVQVKAEEEGEVTADRRLGEPCVSCALLRYYHTTNFWESDPVSLKSALHYALDTLKGAPRLDEIRSFHELPYNAKKPHIMAGPWVANC